MNHTKPFTRSAGIAAIIIALYFLAEFRFASAFDALGPYGLYYFECALILIAGFVYRGQYTIKPKPTTRLGLETLLLLVAGFGAYRLAIAMGLVIPFDLRSASALVLILLIGPVLEEFLFRMALWQAVAALIATKPVAKLKLNVGWTSLALTTLIFAYAHLYAYFQVPPQIQSFVLYQTLYVIGLGFMCGWQRLRTGSITNAVALHIAFNLGFGIASLV